ncbi:cell division protein FtsZ [Candidatus Woesearchaeota archaeon]|nr:cell division protein FtsZ [Candidatus Woesearchaeota archaeon]MBT4595883.1 cell division protein FtsZ [Candidatus Woesearchaeota archaeon]MBT5740769.1 cell division protein FtsZ [Candidatus Woesearchaeota archaeon]MBT6505953.1 cell division protein FtsZ [Candidatus Woesearchaeota archaeon]MBT7296655.1 cell division protein FtsZ [Candidatus Woesearchaeota archaeon]
MEFVIENALKNAEESMPQNNEIGHANIKVMGTGGAGCNMVNWLHKKGVQGAETIAINTDMQHINMISADRKFLIGKEVTKGLGAGGYPQKGAEAAKESLNEIKEVLKNSDMVFVCAGMGGGSGTGSAPIIARVAQDMGAIVIGTVTMPFKIERARVDKAEYGLDMLKDVCDTVVVIDNNRLVQIAGNLPVQQAFAVANELVSTMIKGIVETIAIPSLVNLDFADVKAVMTQGGIASIGMGISDTNNRVPEAVNAALTNPLLDISYEGSSGAIIQITGGPDLTLDEINMAGELVTENMSENANVIWGARVSENMKGKFSVMTIMTGVNSPYLMGKSQLKERESKTKTFSDELGINLMHH